MQKKIFIKIFLLLLFSLAFQSPAFQGYSQQFDIRQIDYRSVNISDLSESQIRRIIAEAESRGLSMQDLEAEAIARGMPYSEVLKLRQRINNLKQYDDTAVSIPAERRFTPEEQPSRKFFHEGIEYGEELRVFGYDLFKRENLSFEPSFNIPTPANYQLGPGDELVIEIWGASQRSYQLKINPEGQIIIDNLGPIKVSGLMVEKATDLIINRLSEIYSGLKGPGPNTFAQVSLGSVRSIKVTIAGDAYMPGTYTLPAFATVFNALYMAGGPAGQGSFREIRVMREGQALTVIDLYDFLLRGEIAYNIRLRDEDVIFIGPYGNRVTIWGELKRPAIYELRSNETLSDLIDFAGGFNASAYKKRLTIDRKTESQRSLLTVDSELFSSFIMRGGDSIFVSRILERYENRVVIQGAVFREGEFSLTDGMTILELVSRAEGLREDAFLNRAALYRLRENLELEVTDIDLRGMINGEIPDIVLQREDVLMISSINDLQQERNVRVLGEVKDPGPVPYAHNITLGEVIRKAGGLNDAASLAFIEVARRIQNREATSPSGQIARIFTFPLDEQLSLNDEAASFKLEPFDYVFVRRSPGYTTQKIAEIRGEVTFPGSYVITRNNERISDLVRRSGGITDLAYLSGATLIRKSKEDGRLRQLAALESGDVEFSIDTLEVASQNIGINLERILRNPYSRHDLFLMEGDILQVPMELQTVRLSGSLLYPVTTPYYERMGVRQYVARAGGFAENARRNKIYVLYPSGSVDKTRNYMFFRSYPNVEPGSEIIVPQKPDREPRTLQETIAVSSAITSLALIIVTLINQL